MVRTKAVSASRDGVLRLWQIQGYGKKATADGGAPTHRELFFFAGITRCVNDCQFTPDGRLVIASSNSGMRGHRSCIFSCRLTLPSPHALLALLLNQLSARGTVPRATAS